MSKSMHEKQKILLKYLELRNWEKILGANRVAENKLSLSLSCLYQDNGDTQDPGDHTPCHLFRDVAILRAITSNLWACAAANSIAILAGILNHQRTCRYIASSKSSESSFAQFDYMAEEEAWWSHGGNRTLNLLLKVQDSKPSTNNDSWNYVSQYNTICSIKVLKHAGCFINNN